MGQYCRFFFGSNTVVLTFHCKEAAKKKQKTEETKKLIAHKAQIAQKSSCLSGNTISIALFNPLDFNCANWILDISIVVIKFLCYFLTKKKSSSITMLFHFCHWVLTRYTWNWFGTVSDNFNIVCVTKKFIKVN